MRLSPRLYDRLLRSLPRLYACRTPEALKQATVAILDGMISCEGSGWFDFAIDDGGMHLRSVHESVPCLTPAIIKEMPRTVARHPFMSVWVRQADPAVLKLSDFSAPVRRRHLDEGREVYREIGYENMTAVMTLDSRGVTTASLRRHRKPFSEEERAIVELLKPHIRQAYANAIRFETLSSAAHEFTKQGSRSESLTRRESEVAVWLAEGKTNREIALILDLAARTVEKHLESILRKLRVENRTAAAILIHARTRPGP